MAEHSLDLRIDPLSWHYSNQTLHLPMPALGDQRWKFSVNSTSWIQWIGRQNENSQAAGILRFDSWQVMKVGWVSAAKILFLLWLIPSCLYMYIIFSSSWYVYWEPTSRLECKWNLDLKWCFPILKVLSRTVAWPRQQWQFEGHAWCINRNLSQQPITCNDHVSWCMSDYHPWNTEVTECLIQI